jgi:hypothetical protein
MVNSQSARLLGPQGVWSCQCQVIPAEDGVTTQRIKASSLTSLPMRLFSFDPKDKFIFDSSYFRGTYYQSPTLPWCWVFFGSFALFVRFGRKVRLSSGFAFHSKLLNESLERFLSWVFCMITQKNLFALADTILTFELWILIPQIIPYRPAVPPCFTGEGSQFLSLAYLSKPCGLVL